MGQQSLFGCSHIHVWDMYRTYPFWPLKVKFLQICSSIAGEFSCSVGNNFLRVSTCIEVTSCGYMCRLEMPCLHTCQLTNTTWMRSLHNWKALTVHCASAVPCKWARIAAYETGATGGKWIAAGLFPSLPTSVSFLKKISKHLKISSVNIDFIVGTRRISEWNFYTAFFKDKYNFINPCIES